jgi:NAD(P)-dependent dehydrogenase (short-subunit alcohol dehydrogenase family)
MLEGKSVLVVGVGTGLGREITAAAVRDGAKVTIAARNEDNLKTIAAELDPDGGHIACCPTDISDTDQVDALAAFVEERFGGLDGLVVNASNDTAMGGIESTSESAWRKTFEINVFATVRVVKAAVPLLKRRGGSVVFIGSQQWIHPALDMPQIAYGASKGAAVSMMYALSRELGAHKIRVNTVVPSWMWGPNVELYVDWQSGSTGRSKDDVMAELNAKFALGEMATDQDVAETVGFFLSDRARSITGQTLLVNAGEIPR